MSPVVVGSRLGQLRELARRVELEIQAEEKVERDRARLREARAAAQEPRRYAVPRGPSSAEQLLERLGVTSGEVKAWAYAVGLVSEIKRGRISLELVESYRDAHQEASA